MPVVITGIFRYADSRFLRTSGRSLYHISNADKSIATTATITYALLKYWTPSLFFVACGSSIISLLMILTPCEKEPRYQGHIACDLRISSCTSEMRTSTVRRTGSHHSCDLTEYAEGGNTSRGTTWKHMTTGMMPRALRIFRSIPYTNMERLSVSRSFFED